MNGDAHRTGKRWLSVAVRIAVIVIGCCVCVGTRGSRSIAAERTELPNTVAGRCASAYFDAFNSGSDEIMQAFQEEYRARAYLERLPLGKRLARYEQLRGICPASCGTITIRTFMEEDKVHVKIVDTGIGIPEERLKGLFDPHFAKNGTRVKAGMGLFTNYNIVQKHRGEIKVESAVGKGSTFTIILPTDLKN
jgi:hypothetical protein